MFAKKLIQRGLYHFTRWRLVRLAAYLLTLATVRERVFGSASPVRKRALILSANKDGVLQDFEACFAHSDSFELITWPTAALDQISAAILAPGLSHNRYLTDNRKIEASKLTYRKFLGAMWKHYTAKVPVDVVMAVNFGYYTQREFAAALEEHGTPLIVLQKENLNGITPRRANFWRVVYEKGRGKFTGRKILVYNDAERELQISSGIVDAGNVIVTGMPRLDRIHKWRREHAGHAIKRPQVLFFGFSRKDKVPVIIGKNKEKLQELLGTTTALEEAEDEWSDLNWDKLCVGTCQAIAAFARSRPDVQVVVKTKAQKMQAEETAELLKGSGELPPNIKMVRGGDPFELITESSVVVGFNTTGLIEAAAAGKPIVVPWFGEVYNEAMRDIVLDLGDAVDYAHSPEELTEKVRARLEAGATVPLELSASSSKMLRRLVGNDDGAASLRVLKAVDAEIGRGQ